MIIIELIFLLFVLVSLFFTSQLFLGLRTKNKSKNKINNNSVERENCIVLVPAHNEENGILKTIESAQREFIEGDAILVVADNCSDNTAKVCTEAGAICIERTNTKDIGKGHALQFGIEHIKTLVEKYKTVVVMDADCVFDNGALSKLLSAVQTTSEKASNKMTVAQALYLMKSPNKANTKLNISEFTWLIKNWVRPLGQSRLGLSCHIQGSGMAFPMQLFSNYSLASSSIVEDLELGLNLVKDGHQIKFIDDAKVFSYFPENEQGLESQRKRWEHGHLAIAAKMPKTILLALSKFNFKLAFQALDAAIPPTIMWILLGVFMFLITIVYGIFIDATWPIIYGLSLFAFAFGLFLSWFNYGKDILSRKDFTGMIAFALSKFGVYKTFISGREKTWVRTKRDDE